MVFTLVFHHRILSSEGSQAFFSSVSRGGVYNGVWRGYSYNAVCMRDARYTMSRSDCTLRACIAKKVVFEVLKIYKHIELF